MYGKLASQAKVPLVPFLLAGLADQPEMFQADQLHPTAAAQERIADNVWKTLEPLLRKKGK
jgi:acyl-CoA thioesterase-1